MTIPVYLFAGFLGSGKTTLLKRVVDHLNARGERPLVLMNEFGESNVDNELLGGTKAEMRELIDGCICCTSKTDLTKTLHDIATSDRPASILMEATGLADPVEILDICTLPGLLEHLQLRGIVSLVDATRWGKIPAAEALMKRQSRYADVLLLNKSDLIDEERRAALLGELAELNPRADLRPTVRAEIDIESLLSRNGSTVERDDEPESHDHRHDHYLSMTLKPKGTAGRAAFEALLTEGAPGLLRAKGFLTVEGLEPQAVVQWTAGHWELIPLPDTIPPRDNVLVFIGEHLDRPGLAAKLRECGLEVAEPHDHDHAHDHHHDHDHHDHGHGHGH